MPKPNIRSPKPRWHPFPDAFRPPSSGLCFRVRATVRFYPEFSSIFRPKWKYSNMELEFRFRGSTSIYWMLLGFAGKYVLFQIQDFIG